MIAFRGAEHRLVAAEELLKRAKGELRSELREVIDDHCARVMRTPQPDLGSLDPLAKAVAENLADLVLDIQDYFAELPNIDHWLDRYLADRAKRRTT